VSTAFEIGDTALERPSRRIVRSAVIQPLVHAGTLLNVSRIGIDRLHDRAGGRVGNLPGMNYARSEGVWGGRCGLAQDGVLGRWL